MTFTGLSSTLRNRLFWTNTEYDIAMWPEEIVTEDGKTQLIFIL